MSTDALDEHPELALVHALADGELSAADAARARSHLATCEACQAELADVMQLAALPAPAPASARGVAGGGGGDVVSLAWYRNRRVRIAGVAIAAAAGVAVWLGTRPGNGGGPVPPPEHGPQLALAAKRPLEARVSWGAAADYRDYDVPRAGEPAREAIPLAALADVEKTGDLHGVGVLELLDGDLAQAQSYLARAGESADVLADRAALALGSAQPQHALALADAALATRPDLAPALWNRGLALRDLGLLRGAAAAFRAVADRHERGWADEAGKRAAALDAQADAQEKRFDRLNHASVALATGEVTVTVEDARAEPGYARGILYDAIRAAPTPARLDALRPLADAVDAADGDTAVAGAIARARAQLHPELAARYGAMIRALAVESQLIQPAPTDAPVPSGAARSKLLADLRAAHADDQLLGVLMKLASDRDTVDAPELPELERLAAASPDPWMQMIGLQQQAQDALRRDDLVGAEAVLLRARTRCAAGAPAFRCIIASELLGDLYLKWLRLPEARAALDDAWTLAARSGEWFLQTDLLERFTNLYVFAADSDGSDLPLVRAYSDEVVRRTTQAPEYADFRCQVEAWARGRRAQVLVNRLDFAGARRELAGPRCKHVDNHTQAAGELFLRAELASQPGAGDDVAALRADIAALRATPQLAAAEQIALDHAEGRVMIDRDPAAGEALLRRAIAAANKLPASAVEPRRVAAWSYAVLATAAAKRGDGDAALGVLAEEQGLAAPAACVLGIALDDQRRAMRRARRRRQADRALRRGARVGRDRRGDARAARGVARARRVRRGRRDRAAAGARDVAHPRRRRGVALPVAARAPSRRRVDEGARDRRRPAAAGARPAAAADLAGAGDRRRGARGRAGDAGARTRGDRRRRRGHRARARRRRRGAARRLVPRAVARRRRRVRADHGGRARGALPDEPADRARRVSRVAGGAGVPRGVEPAGGVRVRGGARGARVDRADPRRRGRGVLRRRARAHPRWRERHRRRARRARDMARRPPHRVGARRHRFRITLAKTRPRRLMKTASLLALALATAAACATPDDPTPAPAPAPAPAETAPTIHPDTACPGDSGDIVDSENWTTAMGIGAIWPLGCNFMSTNVFIRKGPGHGSGDATENELAFVVYTNNAGTTVLGHLYWLYSSDDFVDFQSTYASAMETRTGAFFNTTIGQGGGIDGGNPVGPGHPHVDNGIWTYTIDSSSFYDRIHTASDTMTAGIRSAVGLVQLK